MARTETVTVAFTDLVGSTELASRLGHDAYESLRRSHFEALRSAIAKHNGSEIKTTGDGLMLRFTSAADAVGCAIAMQQAADICSGHHRGARLEIRVGVSSGEATQDGGDLYGPPVVEASRLCAAASAGQTLVSDVVRILTRGKGHRFTSVGELTLKGLPELVPAFEVAWEPLPKPAGATTGILTRNGEYWTVGYGGTNFSLRDVKGLNYIQRLLQHPGEEFHSLDLLNGPVAAIPPDGDEKSSVRPEGTDRVGGLGDAGEMLDPQAKKDYQRRYRELNEELEDLRERGDHERAEKVESELECLRRELARAIGLGGRDRRAGSASERARLSVTRAIKAAVQKISEQQAELGELLDRRISTGAFCSYVSDPLNPVIWQFSIASTGTAGEAAAEPIFSRPDTSFLRAFTEGTTFVGRDSERAMLVRLLEQAQGAQGKIVLIGGAAGVGKTRIAAEIAAEASRRGIRTFVGSCYDRDDPVPFIPFVEILEGALAQARDPAVFREELGDSASEMARLLPQLRRTFPDIPAPIQLPAGQSRRILFSAVTELVKRVSTKMPALFLLDDLQWADEGTLLLLSHVAQFVPALPVMIVGTYRDFEIDPAGHLSRTLDELIRRHLVERVTLDGLAESAVADMLRALSGREPPEALVSLIYSNTEGNPFFVEELFRHLVERGQLTDSNGEFRQDLKPMEVDVPQSLRLVIGRNLARLSDGTLAILNFAAVIGHSFTFELLEAATGEDAEQLLDRVEEGERTGLISSTLDHPAARFRFSHELIRQAVLEGLSPPRRQRIHLRVANAIERLHADALEGYANDLAYHLLRAGSAADDPRRTVRYLAMAAKREISQSAYDSALHHLKNALEVVPKLPEARERDRTELELLIDYGVTLLVLKGWYVPEIGEAYKRARELCKQLGETQRLLSVLFGLAALHLCRGELRVARAYVDEMNSLASDSATDKKILGGWSLGATQFFMGEFADAHTSFEQGVHFYDKQKHRGLAFLVGQDLCVSCLVYDAMTLLILGVPDQAEKRLKESLALARELGYPFTLAYCLTMAAKYYCIRRDFNRLPAVVQETAALARKRGFAFYEVGITAYHIIGLAAQGKTDELTASLRGTRKFSEVGYELAQTWYRSTLAEAFANLGRFKAALQLLDEASEIMERNDERYVESEIKRIRGMLALKQIEARDCTPGELQSARADAEQNFREAKDTARRQRAKLFELRAATSLSRLLINSGRGDEARRILSETYESFTEGFDAPDLRAARAVLEEFSPARAKHETPPIRD